MRHTVRRMDMLTRDQIGKARLAEWRQLAQGLHARFLTDGLGAAAKFLRALSEVGDMERHLKVRIGPAYIDLELVSDDAIYRDDEGVEHTVEWVTQRDVDLANRVTMLAKEHGLRADPTAVSEVELGLDAQAPGTIAPVWAALMTGDPDSQGRGTPGQEVRDATSRVPNLWFDETPTFERSQRFHVEVYVAAEVVAERLQAAIAAGPGRQPWCLECGPTRVEVDATARDRIATTHPPTRRAFDGSQRILGRGRVHVAPRPMLELRRAGRNC